MEAVLAQGVVGKVCEMAIQQAANELSIVLNFREDFEGLKNRIEEIHCALNEADEDGSRKKDSVKNWLHRVRDIAWEAEDILEECAVDSMYETNTQSCTFKCNQLLYRYKIGRRIQKVKARLSSVVVDGSGLNIVRAAAVPHRQEAAESSSRSEGQQSRRWSVLPSESKAVGIESKIESVVNLLETPQIPIIAAVGMGGVGKTYLLQHIYNAQKGRYEKSAWLSISQLYSVSKLQRDLAFQIDEDLCRNINASGISEVLAAEVICRFISEKRCLIVLDDVWRAAREGDLLNKLGIPRGNSQCKILVSTRSREVAVNLNAEIYGMECLRDEESWRLFCAHAFSKFEGNRGPQYLEKVGRNIVKNCGNLPLAIKITAASLARTVEVSEWQSKLSKLKKVGTHKDPVMDVLMLSYDSLPAHLKACFAYVSFFPEDEIIQCEYLIHLWKGEGFVPADQNPWDCLEELANLSLLEVWEDDELDKYCKIHDLLLDLAIQISGENKSAFRVEDAFGGDQWCRLFLAKKDVDEDAISRRPVSPTLVRTLSLSRNTNLPNIPDTLISGMRVLRVLDLSYTDISTLPACVGRMKLLKVLNLEGISGIKEIPECVRHLKSLSYLKLYFAIEVEAPEWIGELRCLQHLGGGFRRMTNEISKLESLRTLRTLNLNLSMKEDDGVLTIEDIGKMKELQEIGFSVDEESQLKRMEEGILAPLEKMRRLRVENRINGMQGESESDLPQFPESMSAMRDLEHLTLYRFAVPSWICCLTNLRYLYLWKCHCSDYPELQEMPSLVSLELLGNFGCRELAKAFGKSGGFPHLRFFTIERFTELEEFPEMEEGAMACLEKLRIYYSEKLNKVGEGLERLKTLKELDIRVGTGTDELKETLKEGGMYWKKIKDINPQINIRV